MRFINNKLKEHNKYAGRFTLLGHQVVNITGHLRSLVKNTTSKFYFILEKIIGIRKNIH